MNQHENELELAISAVRRAAVFCHAIRSEKRIRSMTKADGSPVTNADFGSQALIVEALRTGFTVDPIMAEETADPQDFQDSAFTQELLADLSHAGGKFSTINHVAQAINREVNGSGEVHANWRDRYWVIDPIDGTKGYLKSGQYAIALGLIENVEVKIAALACPEFQIPGRPETGWILAASLGRGAFATPLFETGERLPLHVSTNNETGTSPRMCESLNHSPHGTSGQVAAALGVTDDHIYKMDSQAKYASVASGSTDFYLRLPTSSTYKEAVWDHAAGVLVVTEAGGKVTDIHGKNLVWNDPRTWQENHRFAQAHGVVVTNGLWHDAVLKAISDVMLRATESAAK